MREKKRILLIEDEEDIASLVKLHAEIHGYRLHVEVDGINGYRTIVREKPDLIILDIMLPGENGFDVCRKIKKTPQIKNIPIIILTAKTQEIDELLGLELGADDYIAKPFSPKILFSRVKAVLRRNTSKKRVSKNLSFGDFILEADRYLLKKNEDIVPVTLSEFGILKRLILNKGKVLTRTQLLDDIQGEDSFVVDRNIDVHIASLRKKLGKENKWIKTIRGIGYIFIENQKKV